VHAKIKVGQPPTGVETVPRLVCEAAWGVYAKMASANPASDTANNLFVAVSPESNFLSVLNPALQIAGCGRKICTCRMLRAPTIGGAKSKDPVLIFTRGNCL
jgi:hypothetical protein